LSEMKPGTLPSSLLVEPVRTGPARAGPAADGRRHQPRRRLDRGCSIIHPPGEVVVSGPSCPAGHVP
jgi:hypothetical protein